MRLGLHAPPQGATDRFHQTASAINAGAFLWLKSEQASDAARYSGAMHLVRLDTPQVDEDPTAYYQRVVGDIGRWQPVATYFVIGNEPEVDMGWTVDRWLAAAPGYVQVFRQHGLPVASTPLKVENTERVTREYLALFDALVAHSYWQINHAEDIGNSNLGRSYRNLFGTGKPVIVSEVNAVPASGDPRDAASMDWEERNRQVALWCTQAETDGVTAACLFVADAPADWAAFDIGPEAATEIREWHDAQEPQPAPTPTPMPTPAPPPSVSMDLPQALASLQYPDRKRDAMLMGAALETATLVPPWPDQFGGGPGRGPFQIEAGPGGSHTGEISEDDARDPVAAAEFMSDDYEYGISTVSDWSDYAQALATAAYHAERPAQMYPQDRIAVAYALITPYLAAAPDTPQPTPQPAPTHTARFMTPVDAPIIQGSDGTFSHGGKSTGFYAIDYGCAMGTPIRCAGDGTVSYNGFNHPLEGQTGHTICVQHADGYESRYCHLSEYDIAVGTAVVAGEIIAHSGAPDYPSPGANGFGSGAHLHFSISLNDVWVKVEDLMAQGVMVTPEQWQQEGTDVPGRHDGKADNGGARFLWQCGRDLSGNPVPLNADSGIYKEYESDFAKGIVWGPPVSTEMAMEDGSNRIIQAFTNGIATYVTTEQRCYFN